MSRKKLLRKRDKGFTLIELMVAIGIVGTLSGIVITAVNPAQQFATTREGERLSEAKELQNAAVQYIIDGNTISGLPRSASAAYEICRATLTGAPCIAVGTGYDLSDLAPDYLSAIPVDSGEKDEDITGYRIFQDGAFIQVCAKNSTTSECYGGSTTGGGGGDAGGGGGTDTELISSFFGSTGDDLIYDMTIAGDGTIYAIGRANAAIPATTGAYDETHNGDYDMFVARFSADLQSLLAATHVGGSDDDYGMGVAVASDGTVYISGQTRSSDIPTSGYDTTRNTSNWNGYVARLSADLSSFMAGTYLSGTSNNSAITDLVIDSSGKPVVAGEGFNMPTTVGAYDRTYSGIGSVGYVARLNATLGTLEAATLVGGSNQSETFRDVKIASDGSYYMVGRSASTNSPTSGGAYDTSLNNSSGQNDAYVVHMNSDLTSLLAATYLGASGEDYGLELLLDGSDNPTIIGYTDSASYPTTGSAYDTSHNGNRDFFITKMNATLTSITESTFIGGTGDDVGRHVLENSDGTYTVIGQVTSGYPTTSGAYDETYNGGSTDIGISILSSDLSSLEYSTVVGSSGDDIGMSIATNSDGNFIFAGRGDADFPTSASVYDDSNNGGLDGIITTINSDLSDGT